MIKIEHLTKRLQSLPDLIRAAQDRLKRVTIEVHQLQELTALDDTDLYNATLNERYLAARAEGSSDPERYKAKHLSSGKSPLLIQSLERVKAKRAELTTAMQQLENTRRDNTNLIASLEAEGQTIPLQIDVASNQLRNTRNAKDRLYQTFKESSHQTNAVMPTKTSHTRQHGLSPRANVVTAEALRHTSFETFELPTELGRFLGRLDRNKLAIALTGDSGAGKSHFAFELTRLFSDEGFRTKFYCLEEGFGHLTQEKIHKYNIADDVVFEEHATITEVRHDADKFEVIVIDSFSKLDVGSDEFERLRTDFPRTIFIIIFQKTNTGSIRGGSSIIFNSAATIDVVRNGEERVAHMVKGRYGTQGWKYSITRQLTITVSQQ